MRLITDGIVDREGVNGLAQNLGYTERHIHRELTAVVGAGPLELARAQRAQTARILLESTTLPMIDVAFAAGFRSVRQFNATVREVFALTPGQLRTSSRKDRPELVQGAITLRLPFRAPLDGQELVRFLGLRAIPAVEQTLQGAYRRSLRLPHGAGVVELEPREDHVAARLWLEDLRDLGAAVRRSRALLDLDSDPQGVDEILGADRLIGELVRASPGRRVPGHVDGDELAVRAVLGQQVTVPGAVTLASRLVSAHGEPLKNPVGAITHTFPSAGALLEADPAKWGMPATRVRALKALVGALAGGTITLDAGAEREQTKRELLAIPGIGPWTVEYIAMRALRDPDAFLASDLGVKRALQWLEQDGSPAAASEIAEHWRPYRAYALQHLWALHAEAHNSRREAA
jgi:AraC family transcriptional regulator of adaptative response / DNA-3-methyladenine glycosylase II